ncbi:MAG: YkgJ family cysteine cluster protein [archaeon]
MGRSSGIPRSKSVKRNRPLEIFKDTPKRTVERIGRECGKCGHCCKYGSGIIRGKEAATIAKYLSLAEEEFSKRYLEPLTRFNAKNFRFQLITKGRPYGRCIFLENRECKIQEVKPLYCRIGSCNEHGGKLLMWYSLNYLVNPDDPESLRQWAQFVRYNRPIRGGKLSELVPDKDRLKKILSCEIL